tara:strand:+ start:1789 stop:2511 length:723 start_codon:yes stop_codon:yes gene_type:complete
MKALILVGGKGTRLRPYTATIPKPLLPVGDMPILEIILKQLKNSGVNEVILAVGHMSQLFESFFQNGQQLGINIDYSFEDKPMGTAGAIALSIDHFDDDFIVMNGDLLTTLDYKKMFEFHQSKNSSGTVAISRREMKIDFGIVESDSSGMLSGYIEKPSYFYDFGMGVNIINKKAVKPLLVENEYIDMPDLMLRLREKGEKVYIYREDCFWLDMGRHEDYEKANEVFIERREDFLPSDSE